MTNPSTQDTGSNDNDLPKEKKHKRPKKGSSYSTITRYQTKQRLDLLRDLRIKRVAPHLIVREMGISYKKYQYLMAKLEREDAEMLQLESRDRLQTEINRYIQTADIVIASNLEIVQDPDAPLEDKRESSKIALDAAMTVVRVQSEGSRILRDVFAPLADFIKIEGKPLPLPSGQKDKAKEYMDRFGPEPSSDGDDGDDDDSSIPLSSDGAEKPQDYR